MTIPAYLTRNPPPLDTEAGEEDQAVRLAAIRKILRARTAWEDGSGDDAADDLEAAGRLLLRLIHPHPRALWRLGGALEEIRFGAEFPDSSGVAGILTAIEDDLAGTPDGLEITDILNGPDGMDTDQPGEDDEWEDYDDDLYSD